jgi:hypothetical protein
VASADDFLREEALSAATALLASVTAHFARSLGSNFFVHDSHSDAESGMCCCCEHRCASSAKSR